MSPARERRFWRAVLGGAAAGGRRRSGARGRGCGPAAGGAAQPPAARRRRGAAPDAGRGGDVDGRARAAQRLRERHGAWRRHGDRELGRRPHPGHGGAGRRRGRRRRRRRRGAVGGPRRRVGRLAAAALLRARSWAPRRWARRRAPATGPANQSTPSGSGTGIGAGVCEGRSTTAPRAGPVGAGSSTGTPASLADEPLEVELGDDAERGEVLEVGVVDHLARACGGRRRGAAARSPRRGSRPGARRAACSRARRRVSSGGSCSSMRPHSSMRRMPSMSRPWVETWMRSARSMGLNSSSNLPSLPVEQPVEGVLAGEPPELGVDDLAVPEVDDAASCGRPRLDGAGLAAHLEGLHQVDHAHVGEAAGEAGLESLRLEPLLLLLLERIFTRVTISLM